MKPAIFLSRFIPVVLCVFLGITALFLGVHPARAEPLATVNACGNISSNTTWTSANIYVANNCSVVVNAGVTLTIQAGTIVKFGGTQSALIVNGNLVVTGASGNQVFLTSYKDDAHGGDTNGNGASAGAAGDWWGIHFAAGSSGNIQYAWIGYAASGDLNGQGGGWNEASIRVVNAPFTMSNSTVTAGKKPGIYLEGNGLTPSLNAVTVTDHLSGNPDKPAYGVYQATVNMNPTYTNLVMTGNDRNTVTILWGNSHLGQNVTLSNAGVPYSFKCIYTQCYQYIPSGTSLTLQPGVVFEYPDASFGLAVQSGGSLVVNGTAQAPVVFKGRGVATTQGLWLTIRYEAGSSGSLNYCEITQAGYWNTPALQVYANIPVSNCRIHDNWYDGVWISSSTGVPTVTPVFTNVEVDHNKGYGYLVGSDYYKPAEPTLDGGSVHHNDKTGILLKNYNGATQATIRNMEVSNNGLAVVSDGIYVQWEGLRPVIENVTLNHNSGYPIRINADASPTLKNLTFSGNQADVVLVEGGTITGGRSWTFGIDLPVYVLGNVIIPAGRVLSIPAGTTLYLGPGVYFENTGSLFMIGTAEKPIRFLKLPTARGGEWRYILTRQSSTAILKHCELAYGGSNNEGMFSTSSSGLVVMQNCKVHHSAHTGVRVTTQGPLIHNNDIYSNTVYGLVTDYFYGFDATRNWWGHPSGPYHATMNPNGKGNAVGVYSNTFFNPWLTEPASETDELNEFILEVAGPNRFFPGQALEYAVSYANLTTETITNSVIVMQLPGGADFVSATDGGTYLPGNHQVFWVLGNIAPGANDLFGVIVQYRWGLARDFQDGVMAFILSDTYTQEELDINTYLNYQAPNATSKQAITQGAFDAVKAGDPALAGYYNTAVGQGYTFQGAFQQTYAGRAPLTSAVLMRLATRSVRMIFSDGTHAMQFTFEGDTVKIEDAEGWMTTSVSTGYQEYGGVMAETAREVDAGCTYGRCLRNCLAKFVSWQYIGSKAAKTGGWLLSGFISPFWAFAGTVYEVGDTFFEGVQCKYDCDDPETHCCQADQVRWENSFSARLSNNCIYRTCNPTTQTWDAPRYTTCITFGQRCVPGMRKTGESGCVNCSETTLRMPETCEAVGKGGKPSCKSLENQQAHDPNELAGPEGDLVPGQWITYTIYYENTGTGTAYGVYITDYLPEELDYDSVVMTGPGQVRVPGDRMLAWMIGQVPGTGNAGSSGQVSFKVQVKPGLPGGTLIKNQATVYFPSVPEETPTNTVVNTIQPVVAHPQVVEAVAGTPKAITLTGSEVSGLPLTFAVTVPPLHGELTGTPPNLTYTPAAGFTGGDTFWFTADNGARAPSRPAQVIIQVAPNLAETTPPTIAWTSPANNAIGVPIAREGVMIVDNVEVYLPGIVVGFSEGMDENTLNNTTITLVRSGGGGVPLIVVYDAARYQVLLYPKQALLGEKAYTVTVSTGVTDLAGNHLAAPHAFSFTTGVLPMLKMYLPLVVR